jgi:glycosyltransferase involved in cell wall biosynthesis
LATYKLRRKFLGGHLEQETTEAYLQVFRQYEIHVVLAEYGETGVQVMKACDLAHIPLVVHFHGYDASVTSVLKANSETYPRMFQRAAAVIAVSKAMAQRLISLGAPQEKVHYNPYGVDCEKFGGAQPESAPPVFLTVGRFTDKKAPQLTLRAFAKVQSLCRDAKLRMVGDGPKFEECRQLAASLGVENAVTFLGSLDHLAVMEEMRTVRCFVQHSIEAESGDSEGTPVAILEASATGLPVVSTRHAGIPDVVLEGETGFLVNERDLEQMSIHMLQLATDPELAARFGRAGRARVENNFSREQRLGNLWSIIESCIANNEKISELGTAQR